jgi:hypothetical protein
MYFALTFVPSLYAKTIHEALSSSILVGAKDFVLTLELARYGLVVTRPLS